MKEKESKGVYNPFGSRRGRWKGGKNPKMRLKNFKMMEKDIETIERFIETGRFVNASEALRYFVKSGIDREFEVIKSEEALRKDKNKKTKIIRLKR